MESVSGAFSDELVAWALDGVDELVSGTVVKWRAKDPAFARQVHERPYTHYSRARVQRNTKADPLRSP